MNDISRRDMFKGLLVATAGGLVVRATDAEIQAFGHVADPTPVAVTRTMHRQAGPIGEIVFINHDGQFKPIGVIRDMGYRRDSIDMTMAGDTQTRLVPGLITITYEVVANGAAHVKAAEHLVKG